MNGQTLSHPAAPLIWGEPGTNAQHSFFQWLHQGAEIHPIDILVSRTPYLRGEDALSKDAHRQLVINAIAQAEALALGQKIQIIRISILQVTGRQFWYHGTDQRHLRLVACLPCTSISRSCQGLSGGLTALINLVSS